MHTYTHPGLADRSPPARRCVTSRGTSPGTAGLHGPRGTTGKTLLHLEACGGSHGQVNQHRDLVRASVCVCAARPRGVCSCMRHSRSSYDVCVAGCVCCVGSVCKHCVPWCRIAWCRVWCGIESCVVWCGFPFLAGRVPKLCWVGFRSSGGSGSGALVMNSCGRLVGHHGST